jgi:DNA-binding IclR family transcriptional regulator
MARPSPQTDRVVTLIEALAARPDEPLTLAAVTRLLDTNKSTCHAMLTALVQAGWLLRDPFRKTYRLGSALAAVGRSAAAGFPALELARDAMRTLSHEAAANCSALAIDGDYATVLEQVRDLRAIGPGLDVNVPIPLRAPLGSTVAAWADTAAQERWLAQTPETTRDHHRAVLAAIRRRGYTVELATPAEAQLRDTVARHGNPGAGMAELLVQFAEQLAARDDYLVVDLEPERSYLVSTINAPILDQGRVTLLLSINAFSAPLSAAQVTTLGERVAAACAKVTAAL